MKISNDFNITQKQKLNLTSYVKQSIEILKLSDKDLNNFISEEMLVNPFLSKKKKKEQKFQKNDDIYQGILSNEISLEEYLQDQINLLKTDKKEKKILEFLTGNIDKNGYLDITMSELMERFHIDKKTSKKIISILQTLDPSGIGAFDLQECLLIQLTRKDLKESLAYKIIKNALEDLASNKLKEISKKFGVSLNEINNAKKIILELNPSPGSQFNVISKKNFITPDIIIKKIDGENKVILNSSFNNNLEINSYFLEMDKSNYTEDEIKFMGEKYERAINIIKSIEKRNKTISDISREILLYQSDFFSYGKFHIKKLTQKLIANNLKIHESTVSRAISGKFLECSFGIFELKYFFQSGITLNENQSHSSEKIKLIIKDIIKKENKQKPLSDSEITDILKTTGINISRRCVAKYRLSIDIPPSARRKIY